MAVWYSQKRVLKGGPHSGDLFIVVTTDSIGELEKVWKWAFENYDHSLRNREFCERGLGAIRRRTGRPILKMHHSMIGDLDREFKAIEVPEAYFRVLVTMLRREYVRQDYKVDPENPEVKIYFQKNMNAQVGELWRGTPRKDGGREPPDHILYPEEYFEVIDPLDEEHVSRVRWKNTQIQMLHSRIQASPMLTSKVDLSREASDSETQKFLRVKEQAPKVIDFDSGIPEHLRKRFEAHRDS